MKRFFWKRETTTVSDKSVLTGTEFSHAVNAKKLAALLDFAKGCAGTYSRSRFKPPLPQMIKALTDKIMLIEAVRLMMETDYHGLPFGTAYNLFFLRPCHSPTSDQGFLQKRIWESFISTEVKGHNEIIDLATAPVLPCPRKRKGLYEALSFIGTEINPWEEDNENHRIELWLPMGVAFVNSGHHSISAGQIKRVGRIYIRADSSHRVHDIEPLYKLIRFDGTHYRWIGNDPRFADAIVGKAGSFEFGCIFEIGRLMLPLPANSTISSGGKPK